MKILNFKSKILMKNTLKGLLWLFLIITLNYFVQRYTEIDLFFEYIAKWPFIIYVVYTLSEIIFGIFPPELFIIWTKDHGIFNNYFADISFLAVISYVAGIVGYFIGLSLRDILFFKKYLQKYIRKYENLLNRYAGFLIIVAAITPVPFTAICMLVGATRFDFKKFLLFSSTRFIRFLVYSTIIFYS